MATYTSDKTATTVQARSSLETVTVVGTYTVSANLATNDVLQMVKVPSGATIVDLTYATNAQIAATTTGVVGDGNSTGRFISSADRGAAAIMTRLNVPAGVGYTYTADDTIDVVYTTITTPTTGAVIKLAVTYTLQS